MSGIFWALRINNPNYSCMQFITTVLLEKWLQHRYMKPQCRPRAVWPWPMFNDLEVGTLPKVDQSSLSLLRIRNLKQKSQKSRGFDLLPLNNRDPQRKSTSTMGWSQELPHSHLPVASLFSSSFDSVSYFIILFSGILSYSQHISCYLKRIR